MRSCSHFRIALLLLIFLLMPPYVGISHPSFSRAAYGGRKRKEFFGRPLLHRPDARAPNPGKGLRPLHSFYDTSVTAFCSSTASSWRVVCRWTKLISFSQMRRRIATEFAYVESMPKYERLPAPR